MADDPFSDGLQLNRLHPPAIITFMQGLARRVSSAITGADESEDVDSDSTAEVATLTDPSDLNEVQDLLNRAVQRLESAGYAPDHDVQDHAPEQVRADPVLARINAGALQVAQHVSGVSDSAWTEQPDLLDDIRRICADLSQALQNLGSAP